MFLTAILSALLFFIPLISFNGEHIVMNFTIFGIENPIEALSATHSTWPLIILAALMVVLPVYTALRFKKRELQVKLCKLSMLLNIVFVGLVLLLYESSIKEVIQEIESDAKIIDIYYFTMAIPAINLILEIFAIRGVKKDIELLKSVDRLR